MELKQKSIYLLTSFINSDHSYDFNISAADIAILFIVARYCDLPLGVCCLKQINLAKECRISERTLRERLKIMIEQNLIFRFFRGKLSVCILGRSITGIDGDEQI